MNQVLLNACACVSTHVCSYMERERVKEREREGEGGENEREVHKEGALLF